MKDVKIYEEDDSEENRELICDECGRDMYDGKKKSCVSGFNFNASGIGNHKDQKRVEKEFGRLDFKLCMICYLKALGFKK